MCQFKMNIYIWSLDLFKCIYLGLDLNKYMAEKNDMVANPDEIESAENLSMQKIGFSF